jgi:chromosome segregation protein
MRLKQLQIRGFKSFADEVDLTFEPGITAIVGPNGCGKSNVSDAMRWVLGEQSSRSLRCARMEDVLFNGGSDQKPAKVAEVVLTLSNEDGLLQLDSPTVSICRQLYRTGESRYFLNGAPSLLRDIHELFMDTGVGKSSYSLMEQSNIDLILNTRPEDRRYLFDEVAGINKYKYRKKAALKKLEETEQNLVRINDVIAELENETEALRQQAERALQFRERQAALRALEIELARRQWDAVRARLATAEVEFRTVHEAFQTATANAEQLDASLEAGSQRREALDREITSAQSQVHKLETEIERTESAIALYKERQLSLSEQRQNTATQIENLNGQLERIARQIADRSREREQLQIALGMDEGKLKGRIRVLDELSRQIREAEEQIRGAKAKVIDLMNQSARSQNELTTLENRAEYSKSRQGRLESDIRRLKRALDETVLQVGEARRRVADVQARLASLSASLSDRDGRIASGSTELRKLEAEMRGQQDTLAMAMSRVKSLEELQKSYEGFYLGVRAVLRVREKEPDRLPGICGVVAELVHTEHDYETAIEVALGAGVQNIVAETAEDAKTAIEFLKQNRAGRVTFLPLDILRPRRTLDSQLLKYPGVVGYAPELVKTEPKYHSVVEYLLGNVLIVETLDAAIHISRRERSNMRLVTLDGEIVNPGGAMTGGSQKEQSQGFLQRPREIEDLKERIAQLSDALGKKDARRQKLAEETATLQKERAEIQLQTQAAEIERAEATKDLSQIVEKEERLKDELSVTENELELLTTETGEVARERDEARARVEEIEKQCQSLNRLAERLHEQVASEVSKRAEVESSVTEMKVQLAGTRERIESIGQAIATLEENRVDVQNSIRDYEQSVANSETLIRELEERISEAQRSFLLLEQKKFEHAEEVVRLEAEREQLVAELAEQEKEVRRLRRELERLTKKRHDLDVSVTQMQMEERSIAERIQEKYRTAVQEVAANGDVGGDDYAVAERVRELQSQIETMGAVNLMAIEEYEEHKSRLEFLSVQKNDLVEARDSILKAIQKINETSRQRFLETFEQVQRNFQEVFLQLFGGGETELRLLEAEDVLEAGVDIIARPPGKRPQTITMLSGGERSLVAIALLFALFKIRPSPFCVLDEVDAALDEANVLRFANLIRDFASSTQFILITHNKRTMEKADLLYGVTMERAGVSKLVSVKFGE